jgi:3-methyladenine DNA glycosylase/8-oxoguanine DNA glycosylase
MDKKTALYLSKKDGKLARIIKKAGPPDLSPSGLSPYEALFRSIIYQQLNGKAAATILSRVKKLYPKSRFPKPEEILKTSDEVLRSVGVSNNKSKALKDLALKATEGFLPTARAIQKLSDEEIIKRLTEIRGIGPWSVHMYLMFTLGRPDVMPSTDFGVQAGFAVTYGLKHHPKPDELEAHAEELWKPFRTTASWYMWRAVDLLRDEKKAAEKSGKTPPKKKAKKKASSK